ncbi:MAG: enoyl-CoA hydratase/isomerase family protein, partial [Dehalococcoidales bacterium]|nr:enoyl-CoA hydratase/isomerase family protein [Dehalococcoidales bacterium]
MPNSTVIYSSKKHIARITLNRPRAGNAINPALAQELTDICERINQDDNIYVVVITGAGQHAFCRGNEMEQAQTGKAVETALAKLKETGTGFHVASAIASIDRPVIAAINGDALGQGLELALSCDVRLAAQSARFGFPQVACGLMPGDGGTQRLPRIIGRGKALELILTGEIIDAEEALAIGLVSQVVSPPDLMATAEALAQNIAGKAPIALRFIKEAVNKGVDLTLEQGLR